MVRAVSAFRSTLHKMAQDAKRAYRPPVRLITSITSRPELLSLPHHLVKHLTDTPGARVKVRQAARKSERCTGAACLEHAQQGQHTGIGLLHMQCTCHGLQELVPGSNKLLFRVEGGPEVDGHTCYVVSASVRLEAASSSSAFMWGMPLGNAWLGLL